MLTATATSVHVAREARLAHKPGRRGAGETSGPAAVASGEGARAAWAGGDSGGF
jgi:hypothetical protein